MVTKNLSYSTGFVYSQGKRWGKLCRRVCLGALICIFSCAVLLPCSDLKLDPTVHFSALCWQLQDVARGIAVGAALVTMLYSTNAVLGYVQFRWASLLATNIRFGGMGASKDTLCKQLLDCCNVFNCWVWFFPLGTECWNFVLQSLLRDCRIVYFHSHEDQQNFGASSGDGLCSCAC